MTDESRSTRLKRMTMRSWRRGTKEADMILGPFADQMLAQLSAPDLDLYDALLDENDHDLFQWLSGQRVGPPALRPLLGRISDFANTG